MKLQQIDGQGGVVHEWKSIAQAAEELGLDPSHISKCVRGVRVTHGGYRWKQVEEDLAVDFKPKVDSKEEKVEKRSYDYYKDKAVLSAKTRKSLTSLEEALKFFEVDTSKWEAERWVCNSWDVTNKVGMTYTNYQVKVFLKPKKKTTEEVLVDVNKLLKDYKPNPIRYIKGKGVITAEFADFHIGADIKNLTRTKDFNVKILSDYLVSSAEIINSYNADDVVVNLHGDFFESISGLNHLDSWKSIGDDMYGANVIILANNLLGSSLLSNIKNLKEVNIVAGNHDRMSSSSKEDMKGEGAKLLAWILGKDFPKLKINFNPLILVRNIDGIGHIMTHGNHGISKKDLTKVISDYGDTRIFNLWTEGHLHTRSSKKVLKNKLAVYKDIEIVSLDEMKYRKLVLPPMFTGNFFSEALGYAGNAGVIITENNGRGIPHIHDYTL